MGADKPSNEALEAKGDAQKSLGRGGGLLRSGGIVSFFTMLSRVMGLIRDVLLARTIGADAFADVFFVAFKIPNLFRRLFAEGAFAQAFVPVLGEYRQRESPAAVRELVSRVMGTLGFTLLIVTLVVVVFSPWVTALFAPSWFMNQPEKFAATATMLRITFPYLLFISLTGVAAGILNSYDRFAVPAFTPLLLNLTLIGAALLAAPRFAEPAFALAWGVLIAGAVQFSFQLPFLQRMHMLPMPVVDWQHPGVRKILRLMVPAIFGVSVSQINLLLDSVLATFLPTGSVSWLYYSDRLAELPLGVFGVAIATVILPNLSRHHVSQSSQVFSATLDWALRMVILLAVPATVALVILAEPILLTLFFYGDLMTGRDMEMATLSLRAYAVGVVAFMLIKVLAPGFFARQDMRTPVRIGIIAMVVNMVLNIVFLVPLHVYWEVGHVGLALATSVAAFLNAALLFRQLRKQTIYQHTPGWWLFTARLLVSVSTMGIAVILMAHFVGALDIEVWKMFDAWQRSSRLLSVCFVGALCFALTLLASGLRFADVRGPQSARTDAH